MTLHSQVTAIRKAFNTSRVNGQPQYKMQDGTLRSIHAPIPIQVLFCDKPYCTDKDIKSITIGANIIETLNEIEKDGLELHV